MLPQGPRGARRGWGGEAGVRAGGRRCYGTCDGRVVLGGVHASVGRLPFLPDAGV
jgi:hypothetical protein